MERYILTCIFLLGSIAGFSQHYTKEDSIYVYEHFIFYEDDGKTIYRVDKPYLDDFHDSIPDVTQYYFYKAMFMEELPVEHRIFMSMYLPYQKQKESLQWMYAQLKKKNDKLLIEDFLWIIQLTDFYRTIPFSELGISQKEVKKYCKECSYR